MEKISWLDLILEPENLVWSGNMNFQTMSVFFNVILSLYNKGRFVIFLEDKGVYKFSPVPVFFSFLYDLCMILSISVFLAFPALNSTAMIKKLKYSNSYQIILTELWKRIFQFFSSSFLLEISLLEWQKNWNTTIHKTMIPTKTA